MTLDATSFTALRLVRGDDYWPSGGSGHELAFSESSVNPWPDLTNAQSILFTVKDYSDVTVLQVAATSFVTVASGVGKRIDIDLASSQTNLLSPGAPAYQYDIEVVLSSTAGSHKATLMAGDITVIQA